jgi:hypothetical protein
MINQLPIGIHNDLQNIGPASFQQLNQNQIQMMHQLESLMMSQNRIDPLLKNNNN